MEQWLMLFVHKRLQGFVVAYGFSLVYEDKGQMDTHTHILFSFSSSCTEIVL